MKELLNTTIGSFGGISLFVILKFAWERIDLYFKDQRKLNSEMIKEAFQSDSRKKEYISKTRFDTEFNLFRELNGLFFAMIRDVSFLFPTGLTDGYLDKEQEWNDINNKTKIANNSLVAAQNCLYANSAFIREEFFNEYVEILQLCNRQINTIKLIYSGSTCNADKESYKKPEDYERTKDITEKWLALNKKIRKYLSLLDVV